jgi:hypothetical protein
MVRIREIQMLMPPGMDARKCRGDQLLAFLDVEMRFPNARGSTGTDDHAETTQFSWRRRLGISALSRSAGFW